MVKKVQDDFGSLDILCNNVGIQFVSSVEEFPEEKWDAIMDICLNSTFHATKAALPMMLENKWGRIINTGSMHALVASPYKSAYNAAKHGVVRICYRKTLLHEKTSNCTLWTIFSLVCGWEIANWLFVFFLCFGSKNQNGQSLTLVHYFCEFSGKSTVVADFHNMHVSMQTHMIVVEHPKKLLVLQFGLWNPNLSLEVVLIQNREAQIWS